VIEHCGLVFNVPAPAGSAATDDRLVYLGDDPSGRALEVIAVEMESAVPDEQHLRVVHAMELRKKYRVQYEEASKWRV
jgi:hypothetical protein